MGLIAERAGLSVALAIAAAGLALSPLAGLVWRAWHDASDPGRVLEEFVVASWDDHVRQHERVTKREQAHLERVRELTDPDHPVHDKLVELRLFGANGTRQRCANWSGCQFPRQYRFAGATRASFSFATTAT